MQEPAFDELRTKQQLGYVVFVQAEHMPTWTSAGRGDLMQHLAVIVQGAAHDAAFLDERISAFVGGFEAVVRGVSQRQWRSAMRSVRSTKLRRPLSVSEAAVRRWEELSKRTFRFQRRNEEAAALQEVSVDEVVALFKQVVLGSADHPPRRVSVEVFGKGRALRAPTGPAAATPIQSLDVWLNGTTLV